MTKPNARPIVTARVRFHSCVAGPRTSLVWRPFFLLWRSGVHTDWNATLSKDISFAPHTPATPMRRQATISLRGTRYYGAPRLLTKDRLRVGEQVSLRHEATNPHDPNAVAVHVKSTGSKLGHLPREYAPKYAALVDGGAIISAKISSVSIKEGDGPVIRVSVVYVSNNETESAINIQHIPATSGVYSIRSTCFLREYVGSSVNMKARVAQHSAKLHAGRHANYLLQRDFSNSNGEGFFAVVLTQCPADRLAKEEASFISERLASQCDLYNMTQDGQGNPRGRYSSASGLSISDAQTASSSLEAEPETRTGGRPAGCAVAVAIIAIIPLTAFVLERT